MSGLFGPGTSPPSYVGLQVQTSSNAIPVPIVWGRSKLAPNAIWYNNFTTTEAGGKGGLFGGSSGYDYKAAVMMGLCEGPIAGIGVVWKDQSVYNFGDLGLGLIFGRSPQPVWSYLTAAYPDQAVAYPGTAIAVSPNYDLGSSATISNHNFEVSGLLSGTGYNGVDADPAQIVSDFLTNPQYGVRFPAASISATTLLGASGDASYQTYCKAVGLALSPCLISTEKASSILQRWLDLTNTAAVWSAGLLKFVPYGDIATTTAAQTTTELRQVQPPAPNSSGTRALPVVRVAFGSQFGSDGGVVYTATGAALTPVGSSPARGQYVVSNGVYSFAAADDFAQVSITYTYTPAAAYTPNVTPIYDLGDDDFKRTDGADPVKFFRSDPYQATNILRVEVAERSNSYNLTAVECRDQAAIELFGERVSSSVTAHEICNSAIGQMAGQLMMQRAAHIRTTYKWSLSWEYCLLEPMDIVTLTDSVLGMSKVPVRITEIDEDQDGVLTITAEEFPVGVGTATLYPVQPPANVPVVRNVGVAPVNTPVIFEPPAALVSSPQVWIAASGGNGGVADPTWGGCNVYLSLDGTTYQQVGTINAPARQGVLSAALAAFSGSNPDTADTLAVDLTESAGVLSSAPAAGAAAGQTLCIVDGELLAFQTATLTSAAHYSLTSLYRGLYGTQPAAHSSGALFARLDGAVLKYSLPQGYIGKTIYIKLQSFNVFGSGAQDISTCAVYTYTPTGAATDHPVARMMMLNLPIDFGDGSGSVSVTDDFGDGSQSLELLVDLGN